MRYINYPQYNVYRMSDKKSDQKENVGHLRVRKPQKPQTISKFYDVTATISSHEYFWSYQFN